jgi:two-component system, LytTR family, sensor histidine kinase AlgZ
VTRASNNAPDCSFAKVSKAEARLLPEQHDASQGWLPNFLSANALLMLMSAAEMIVLIALLAGAPSKAGFWAMFWQRFGPASLLAQWIAICAAFGLSMLRPRLARLSTALSSVCALTLVGCIAFLCVVLSSGAQVVSSPVDTPALTLGFATRIAFVAVLVTAGALRYSYVQRQWSLEVQANARVKVEALTARIRPHFLFNSMNTLASLIAIDPERAEQVVEDLSELFRAALKAGEHDITLGEELELARHYLRIEQLRLGPRLAVEFDITQAPLEFKLPALLLQPLVENAVYHGIQPLEAGGTVRLRVERVDRALRISIENPTPAPSDKNTAGNGMAQANIRARLRLAFGESARLQTSVSEALHYRAVVTIPLRD